MAHVTHSALPLTAALLTCLCSPPAAADCTSPAECICPYYQPHAVAEVAVTFSDSRSTLVQVRSVRYSTSAPAGLTLAAGASLELEPQVLNGLVPQVGQTLLVALLQGKYGELGPQLVLPVDASGAASCSSLGDFSLPWQQAQDAMLMQSFAFCEQALMELGLKVGQCDDVVEPGCSVAGHGAPAAWGLLPLLVLAWGRRRRARR